MQRNQLINLLSNYHTEDLQERQHQKETLAFVQSNPDCFERSLLPGHVTGSAWIVNPSMTHTLLIHHYKLDKWFQPGGHCDGDPDVLMVAMKEAFEETGVVVTPFSDQIFDIDNHIIPARQEVPQHIHYDIRFLFIAQMTDDDLPGNRETKAIKWASLNDVTTYTHEISITRMIEKTRALAISPGRS